MGDLEDDGTLQAPGIRTPQERYGEEAGLHGHEDSPQTHIIKKEPALENPPNGCPKCGLDYVAGALFCPNCGTTLSRIEIRDMRNTLDEAVFNRSSQAEHRPEVQKITTSYRSGILAAKSEREGISPIPSPQMSQAHHPGRQIEDSRSKSNLALAIAIIAFLSVIVIILILLITKFI